MKRIVPSLFFFILFSTFAKAQTGSLHGAVADTVNKVRLSLSSVSLLRKNDSVLVTYTRTNGSGQFSFSQLPKGNFIILVTHPGFADYTDDIQLGENSDLDLGNIMLTPRSKLLEEIIIRKTIPSIQVKGDTLIYKADSFQVQKGANVEDLLKKLPGLTVDKNGQITAQGERVQKVLVDGEEFFSDDPTIATRNLMADMVEDVQVFDKKSDQAAFTGIDDGQKQKTINLKLKEDKKKGYFGKLELGSDFKDYWNNNAMINSFKGKRKMAAYGIMSNTGKTGLDWRESMNYGGSGGNMEMGVTDDGGMYISVTNNDEFDGARYWGEGLPSSWSGGLHYSDKWGLDKNHLSANYRYGKINNEAISTIESQYILPDTLYYTRQLSRSDASRFRHKIDGVYEYQIDSSTSVKWNGNGATGETSTRSESLTESLNEEGFHVNDSHKRTSASGENKSLNNNLLLRKKFKNQGQTFSLTLSQNFTQTETNGFLNAENNFYDSKGDLVSNELIDQQKINKSQNLALNARASYTQPISKKSYLEFNYGLGTSNQRSTRTTLEKSNGTDPKYDQVVEALSNDFEYRTLANTGGMNFRFVKNKKYNFSFGGSVSQNQLNQKDLIRDTTLEYNFVNFFPMANFNLTMKGNKNLRFNYNGATRQPSISQLQPILDNNDPLNIYIGNPNLKVALNHRFNLSFNMYNFLSNSGIWGTLGYRLTQRDFGTRDVVDSVGRHIYQTVNVDGNYDIYSYFNYSFKIKKPGIDFNIGYDLNKNRNKNFVNGDENIANSFGLGPNVGIGYSKEKKISLWLRSSFMYNYSKSSIREEITTRFWTQDHNVDVKVFLPWKLEVNTDVNFNLRQKTEVFERDQNVISWNASVDRKLFKDDAARIRLYAYDLLDQNRGFRRDISSNFISERSYNTVRRYFLVSFIWNFSKNGKPQDF